MNTLSTLPYKIGSYDRRNWGHPLHFLCSYPSKLKPSISHFLVNLFTDPGDTVLDPFSGVGTIPFEACSLGRVGIGSDINPFAFRVTMAKVDPPSWKLVKSQILELEKYILNHKDRTELEAEEEILEYYHPDTMKEILAAKEFFDNNSTEDKSFLMACILHILHGNRPYALSRRSHNIMPWPPKGESVYKSLIKLVREKAERTISSSLPLEFKRGRALKNNVEKLDIPDSHIDALLTSPPFYNNRDFLRMNRIRLWFAGWDYVAQSSHKGEFLESHKDIGIYTNVFNEFYRVLKPGAVSVLHLGVVKTFDMAKELMPYAEKSGFITFSPIYEDTTMLESHGIVQRGATNRHQFLILLKPR